MLGSCESAFEPPVPAGPPPASYRAWYAEAEACSGIRGDFEAVTWYVGGPPVDEAFNRQALGRWLGAHRIWISAPSADIRWIVVHESLHELRQRGGHPDVPFKTCHATLDTYQQDEGALWAGSGI